MDTISILKTVESSIKNTKELRYYWTHSVRYSFILQKVQDIARANKLVILDIGCFPYHVGKALEMLGHEVHGISSHHEEIKNKHIAVLNIETEKFPFKDNFFDLVLCNEVIEHLPQSPIPPIHEMHRVLKKDGHLMVTTPNISRSINRVKLLLGFNIQYPISVFFEENGKGNNIYHRHNREYTLSELATIIQQEFTLDKKEYFISYTPFRKRPVPDSPVFVLGKIANYFLMGAVPFLRDTLFILGKK